MTDCDCCGFEIDEKLDSKNQFKYGSINDVLCIECFNFAQKKLYSLKLKKELGE
jgi:hypothetical protein